MKENMLQSFLACVSNGQNDLLLHKHMRKLHSPPGLCGCFGWPKCDMLGRFQISQFVPMMCRCSTSEARAPISGPFTNTHESLTISSVVCCWFGPHIQAIKSESVPNMLRRHAGRNHPRQNHKPRSSSQGAGQITLSHS